ncbi:Hypothetical predicted protein, partial [Paramuricea clavata]
VQSNETDMCAPNNVVGQAINSVNANNIKPGQYITFREEHQSDKATAKVISRAGKATGKHKYWFNIDYLGTSMDAKSIDLSQVEELEIIENSTEEANIVDEVMFCHNLSFDSAKQAELKDWKDNDVYVEVPNEKQKCVSTRWVLTLKHTETGITPKARLVARGFEENNPSQSDSPTCANESLRIVIAIIAQMGWTINSIDIKTAFLQGNCLDRDIFIRPPK